jgi:hypothetical protein
MENSHGLAGQPTEESQRKFTAIAQGGEGLLHPFKAERGSATRAIPGALYESNANWIRNLTMQKHNCCESVP